MDWSKIVDNLKTRALSTNYEGERQLCLKKIDEILLKHNVEMKSVKTKQELFHTIPIKKLREIFIETYFPWFLKEDAMGANGDTIYFGFSSYELEYIAKEKIKEINPSSSVKFMKYMKSIGEWAMDEYDYIKSLPRTLQSFYHFNYYIEIEIPFAIWCLPNYIVDQLCNLDKNKIIEQLKLDFDNNKNQLLKDIHSGYYDRDIRELFDPKLLEG